MGSSIPVVFCQACGSPNGKLFLETRSWNWAPDQIFSLVRCSTCGFVYLNEIMPYDVLNYVYSHPINKRRSGFGAGIADAAMRSCMKLRAKKIEAFTRVGAILDVGCANGLFLEEMHSRGWQSYGVDISPNILDLPGSKKGIKFLCGSLTSITMPEPLFDAITFWHSLEHVHDPCAVLTKARTLLKDDGILFISVPNIESFEARMNKKKWFGLELPAHCCHYSPSTLALILERNGFTVRSMRKNSLEYNLPFFAQSLFNSVGGIHDFLQKKFKGCASRYRTNSFHEVYTVALIVALSPLAVIMTLALYFVNIVTGNGPVIEAEVKKNDEKK